ncbi:MAG: hypothetical protein JWN81_5 [Solirubrobacterales bacterium]|nr:hypothetical protein [Solirubrobacterales bacterium]
MAESPITVRPGRTADSAVTTQQRPAAVLSHDRSEQTGEHAGDEVTEQLIGHGVWVDDAFEGQAVHHCYDGERHLIGRLCGSSARAISSASSGLGQ